MFFGAFYIGQAHEVIGPVKEIILPLASDILRYGSAEKSKSSHLIDSKKEIQDGKFSTLKDLKNEI